MHEGAILTICSVYYSSQSRQLLELNGELTRRLNPGASVIWLAGNNAPPDLPEAPDPRYFSVVEGGNDHPAYTRHPGRGNYHHGAALNRMMRHVHTPYLLILDMDFFIVRPNWIRDVLDYMRARGLAAFGSTWHPKYYAKYRYFPSVHCMFLDCRRIAPASRDFLPKYPGDEGGLPLVKPARSRLARRLLSRRTPWPLRRIAAALSGDDRRQIGSSRDTGYALYARYGNDPAYPNECLQAVFRPGRDLAPVARMLYWPNRVIERALPDRRCFIPKRPGYFSTTGFDRLGYPDVSRYGWEEFLWQGRPFAFHIRGTRKAKVQSDSRVLLARRIISAL